MKLGDTVQYFDNAGTNRPALVTAVQGAGQTAVLSLITVIDGHVEHRQDVPHREARITVQPPRDVVVKDRKKPGFTRVIGVVTGERKRTPGDFWFE